MATLRSSIPRFSRNLVNNTTQCSNLRPMYIFPGNPFTRGLRLGEPYRLFSTSRAHQQKDKSDGNGNGNGKESFGKRLRKALGRTKIRWYNIPVGLGIAFLGLGQFYRVTQREKQRRLEENAEKDSQGRPKKRPKIRHSGPWYAH
jgi:phosphatidylserine decarboxylase